MAIDGDFNFLLWFYFDRTAQVSYIYNYLKKYGKIITRKIILDLYPNLLFGINSNTDFLKFVIHNDFVPFNYIYYLSDIKQTELIKNLYPDKKPILNKIKSYQQFMNIIKLYHIEINIIFCNRTSYYDVYPNYFYFSNNLEYINKRLIIENYKFVIDIVKKSNYDDPKINNNLIRNYVHNGKYKTILTILSILYICDKHKLIIKCYPVLLDILDSHENNIKFIKDILIRCGYNFELKYNKNMLLKLINIPLNIITY